MRPEKPDHQDARLILHASNQSVVVALDVEHDPAGLQNACLWIGRLDVLRVTPFGAGDNVEPGIVLRLRRFDPLVAGMIG